MEIRAAKRSLVGGEVDPELQYASDLAPVRVGAAICKNFIVRAKGGVERTPGTEFLFKARTSAGTGQIKLGGFRRANAAAYLVELSENYMRVFDADAAPEDAPIDELVTPYSEAENARLSAAQSNDVQFLFSGQKIKQLVRDEDGLGGYTFSLEDAVIRNGPFLDQNYDEAFAMAIGGSAAGPDDVAAGQTVTITCSSSLFEAGHVGSYWRLDELDLSATPKWEVEVALELDDIVRWSGNVYRVTVAGTTSNNAPSHTLGRQLDSTEVDAVEFEYLHSGYGIFKVLSVVSATEVQAEVVQALPASLITDASYRWREPAWSDILGYPHVGTFYKNALWAANTPAQPYNLWKSAIDGFDDFEPGTADDDALTRGLFDTQTEAVRWLTPSKYMVIGTDGPEWVARPDTEGDTVRVTNLITEVATNQGSSEVPGINIDAMTLFVNQTRTKMVGLHYDWRQSDWAPKDLSILAEHILGAGVKEMAYQRTPWPLVWCLLDDGTLAAMTYQPEQEVTAWHRHDFGDPVESIEVLPVDGGAREALFLAIRRTETEVHIERMADRYRNERSQPQAEARYLFGGKAYSLETPTTTLTGLDHLEGRTVRALVDGKSHPLMTVTGGAVELNFAGSEVFVGLAYESVYKTLPFDYGQPDNFQSGRPVRIADLGFAFSASLGGYVRSGDGQEILFRTGSADLDVAPPLFTGVKKVNVPSVEGEAQIEYVTDEALPVTITAIFPEYEV